MGRYLPSQPSERMPLSKELAPFEAHAEKFISTAEGIEDAVFLGNRPDVDTVDLTSANAMPENQDRLLLCRDAVASTMVNLAEERGVIDSSKKDWIKEAAEKSVGKRTMRKSLDALYRDARNGDTQNVAEHLKEIFEQIWEVFLELHGIENKDAPKNAPEVIKRRAGVRQRVEGVVRGVTAANDNRPAHQARPAGRWPDLGAELRRLGFNNTTPEKFERSAMQADGSVRPAWGGKKNRAVGGPGPDDLDYGRTGTHR